MTGAPLQESLQDIRRQFLVIVDDQEEIATRFGEKSVASVGESWDRLEHVAEWDRSGVARDQVRVAGLGVVLDDQDGKRDGMVVRDQERIDRTQERRKRPRPAARADADLDAFNGHGGIFLEPASGDVSTSGWRTDRESIGPPSKAGRNMR